MSMLFFTGSKLNAFARGTLSISPTAASVSAAANVCDNDPGCPLLFGSIAADSYIQVTLNALANPGFETSTLSGWTAGSLGTGTSAETTTAGEFRSGTKALELTGSDTSNYGSRYQSITVAAGEYRKATFYGRGIGAGTGKLFLKNLKTGNYYNGASWASTRAAAVSSSATTAFPGTAVTVTYQVESFDACMSDTASLRWELACESGDFCFDDCLDVPGISFASIHGHNLGPVVPTVRSSDDGSSWTDRVAMTLRRPAFFGSFSIIYAEYWRIVLVGTNHEAPYIGEAVLGQPVTSTTSPQWGFPVVREFQGVRLTSPSKRVSAYNTATDPTESTSLVLSARTEAASKELANALFMRSAQGQYPVVLVPIDSEAPVYYGRLLEPNTVARPFQGVYETTIPLAGDPFPNFGL